MLRLPDFYGPGVDKSFLHAAFTAAVTGGTATMIGPLDIPHVFVFVPDVGPVVARLMSAPNAYGRVAPWRSRRTTQQAISRKSTPDRTPVAGGRRWEDDVRLLGLFNPFMSEMVEVTICSRIPS